MEIRDIPIDVIDPTTNYGQLAPVVAVVTKIVKEAQGYTLIGIRDFVGLDVQALIRGQSKPTVRDIGKTICLTLSATTKGKYTNYSGFYNPSDQVPQQYVGKVPPAPTQTSTSGGSNGGQPAGGKTGGSGYDAPGKNRGFALSYAKDLVVAGKAEIGQIGSLATVLATYLDTGKFPESQPAQPTTVREVEQAVEQEIPEMDRAFTGEQPFFGETSQDTTQNIADVVQDIPFGTVQGPVLANNTAGAGNEFNPVLKKEDTPF